MERVERRYVVGQAAGRVVATGGLPAGQASPRWVVHATPQPHPLYDVLQRCIDVVLSLALLVVALPVVLIACLAIVLTTGQAPLLTQRRVGWQGQEFTLFKLRTMSDEGTPREGLAAKLPFDERVTAVGRLLRRTSIDELPQLVNVLVGKMTLVGPRPPLPNEVAEYQPRWLGRLSVKPGLSGLWQVSGRSSLPLRRWMALDRVYLRRRSTAFDVAILVRTAAAVASMRGAW